MYAEDVGNYWKTGQSAPDTWIDKAKEAIKEAGGKTLNEAYGRDGNGRAAYMLELQLPAKDGEVYRVVWPVLPSRTGNERAARIQAATMLYHDVKARCVSAKVLGLRAAFFNYLLLPDGRTAGQLVAPEIVTMYPRLLAAPNENT